MTTFHHIRFSGVRETSAGLQVFHPGLAGAKSVTVSLREKPDNDDVVVPMQRQGDYWVSPATAPLKAGMLYQIQADGKPVVEATEQKIVQDAAANDAVYNVAPDFNTPQKSGPMVDVFQDSLVSREKLQSFLKPGDPLGQTAYRDHFNQFGGNEAGLKVLYHALDPNNAMRAVVMRPVIGGDDLSANKYWTQDLFGLNNTFSSKAAMKDFLMASLRRDTKVFFDGAFVNEGLNGVHMLANLRHGERSPYWNQFVFPDTTRHDLYPKLIQEDKKSFGVLPTLASDNKADFEIDYSRFAFRVENDPQQAGYHPAKPTYIRLFDPKKQPGETLGVTWFDKSVQQFRFPVKPEELARKRAELQQARLGLSPQAASLAEKRAFCDWSNFRLVAPQDDSSAVKWDGQIDVAKMNMRNPEVQAMVREAMVYWTRFVRNEYQTGVAEALAKTARLPGVAPQDWAARIAAITANPAQPSPRSDLQILPPERMRAEAIRPADIEAALATAGKMDIAATGRVLAEGMLTEFPLTALTVPIEFKAALYLPTFRQEALQSRGALRQSLYVVARPLLWVLNKAGLDRAHRGAMNFLNADTVEARLAQSLERELLPQLSPQTREKLRHPQVRSLIYERLAEDLFLKMLTNQHDPNPQSVEAGLFKTVPAAIHTADPLTAARLLSPFLKNRLKQVDYNLLAQEIEKKLAPLDAQTVCVAEAILNRREFGLNWRIDAAKDVGDMDHVRNPNEEQGEDKGRLFADEMNFVHGFFKNATEAVKSVFPKATVIAELTDCNEYGNAMTVYRRFLDDGTFTSMPNFDRMFNTPARLIHMCPTPWGPGPGNKTISPFYFLGKGNDYGAKDAQGHNTYGETYAFNTLFPWHTARQFQNLNASHDASSLSQNLLYDGFVRARDLKKDFYNKGAKIELKDAVTELSLRGCYDDLRKNIFSMGVREETLKSLAKRLEEPDLTQALPESLRSCWSWNDPSSSKYQIIPPVVKKEILLAIKSHVTPQALGVTPEAHTAIFSALERIMVEPSETRSIRAVINNAMENDSLWRRLNENLQSATDVSTSKETIRTACYNALNHKTKEYGRHFGYLPLDRLVHEIVEAMPSNATPAGLPADTFKRALKNALYDEAIEPVLVKLQRAVALNVAIPGNPTINLPDLLGQTGGENEKNMFLQNRPLIRHDWLEAKPNIRAHLDALGEILRLRTDYESLNNGFVYIPQVPHGTDGGGPTADDLGVVPLIRDNGDEQTVMLINTGKPTSPDYNDTIPESTGRRYFELTSQQPVAQNYKADLSPIDVKPGTTYRDVKSGERFVVNDQRLLVSADQPDQGMDIAIYRLLKREPMATAQAS